ncbi:hypothetical protein ES332_A01G272800v1 [Gossypium tomentosum]|nr:hypothetical protein ES332_A01G272800v1 [Gossypium tomentosum]
MHIVMQTKNERFNQSEFRVWGASKSPALRLLKCGKSASIVMFGSMIRYFSTKPKPKMKPIELKTSLEQTQTISRVTFDILKEHGPLTVGDTWERVKEVGLRGLTSKRHMKIVLRWMRGRQNIRLICNHVGPHKQFL